MIKRFSDHAANERTFLAWVRTAIAVMAFGFLIERFDLFLLYAAPQLASRTLPIHGQRFANAAGLAFFFWASSWSLSRRSAYSGRRKTSTARRKFPAADRVSIWRLRLFLCSWACRCFSTCPARFSRRSKRLAPARRPPPNQPSVGSSTILPWPSLPSTMR
jgi:putative membrane protein